MTERHDNQPQNNSTHTQHPAVRGTGRRSFGRAPIISRVARALRSPDLRFVVVFVGRVRVFAPSPSAGRGGAAAAKFFNLVTGARVSALGATATRFWRIRVALGVAQRFGPRALTRAEALDMRGACARRPRVLRSLVLRVAELCGVRFTPSVVEQRTPTICL